MPRKRHKPEEIVAKLRQVDVLVSKKTVCRGRRSRDWPRGVGGRVDHRNVVRLIVRDVGVFPVRGDADLNGVRRASCWWRCGNI